MNKYDLYLDYFYFINFHAVNFLMVYWSEMNQLGNNG